MLYLNNMMRYDQFGNVVPLIQDFALTAAPPLRMIGLNKQVPYLAQLYRWAAPVFEMAPSPIHSYREDLEMQADA